MTDRVDAYAQGMLAVAQSEGDLESVSDELFRFARALDGTEELRSALTDPHLPASRRQQIVEDLLGGRASQMAISLVSMVVGAGRARELPAIIDELVSRAAEQRGRAVAEVRSVVELSEVQRSRLADAINKATGKTVEVKVVIDPSILGGLVTTVGDTVIDGSVKTRLEQLKQSF